MYVFLLELVPKMHNEGMKYLDVTKKNFTKLNKLSFIWYLEKELCYVFTIYKITKVLRYVERSLIML